MTNERLHDIDIAKCIGIILVVFAHIVVEGVANTIVYSFHMPLFFVVSGMLLGIKKGSMCRSKVFGLLIPYVLWSVISAVFQAVIHPESFISYLFGSAINTLIFYGIAPFWFLSCLFVAEVAVILILQKVPKLVWLLGVTSLAVGVSLYYLKPLLGFEGYLLNAYIAVMTICFATVFVSAGYYLSKVFVMIRDKRLYLAVAAIVSGALTVIGALNNAGINFHMGELQNPFLFVINGVLGSIFVLSVSSIIRKCNLLEYIGKNSMGIMCCHYQTVPLWFLVMGITGGIDNHALAFTIEIILLLLLSLVATQLLVKICPTLLGKKGTLYRFLESKWSKK